MPLLVADPYAINGYLFDGSDYSHLTPATRCTQVWLERNGYRYDVITDLDLHKNPGALGGYRTVIIAGHSEYWSVPAYDSLKSYLQSNGNLVVLSGNTMYWRVSFDPDCTVMEIRKVDGVGEQYQGRRGEVWHSDDGLRGGLMRESGFPGWQLIGLETQGIDTFATFYLTNLSHPLFSGLAVTNGQATCAGLVGHESDARVSTLEANRLLAGNPVPNTATIPLEPPGIVTLATGLLDPGETANDDYRDYFMQILGIKLPPPVHSADLIYWERPDGGRVFNAGGIATGIGLSRDPVFAGLVSNVLATFTKPDTWVDFNWTGSQSGTFDFPFSTLASGLSAAPWGGTLRIKAGHTAETGTISKRIYINSYGGAATIGR
jgi:hypothetical protein